jgi:hypothetical protein
MNLPISSVQSSTQACHLWVETLDDGQVLAWVGEWPECRVTADSRDRAIADLEQLLDDRMERVELVIRQVEAVPTETIAEPHPMLAFAGVFKNDPDFAEIVAQMRAERELDDDNPAYTLDW